MALPTQANSSTIPTFLCDEMLQRLGRWLRAAGYDVVISSDGSSDYELLRQALDEGRLLLTRDRAMAEMRRAQDTVILLQSESLEACARELTDRLTINWQWQPFSRCLQCNSPLSEATEEQLQSAPPDVKPPVYYCATCRQVFWDGSHAQRMREHLVRWQAGDFRTTEETID